jgi:hypothetical protein
MRVSQRVSEKYVAQVSRETIHTSETPAEENKEDTDGALQSHGIVWRPSFWVKIGE